MTLIMPRGMGYKIEVILSEDQIGFRKNMGTREVILTLRTIIEKIIMKDKPTYIAFVDIEKAFDNVNWSVVMFKILKRPGVEYTKRNIPYLNYTKRKQLL